MNAPEPFQLTDDERELIKLAEEAENFIIQPMWKKIEIFLNAFVQEALDDIRGNQSVEGLVALHKQRVWREREALRDSLIAFVKGPIKDKKELMQQIEEQRKAGLIYHAGHTNPNE
jgi:hypothetical protein